MSPPSSPWLRSRIGRMRFSALGLAWEVILGLYPGARERSVLEWTAGHIHEDTHLLLNDLMKGKLPIAGSRSKQTLIVGWREAIFVFEQENGERQLAEASLRAVFRLNDRLDDIGAAGFEW